MSTTACRQCGSSRGVSGGRCRECGGVIDAARVARRERRARLLHRRSGDPFAWLEALPGLVIVLLVVLGALPWPVLALALVLSVRPLVRLVGLLAAAFDG